VSTDYYAVCEKHRLTRYVGYRWTAGFSFGHSRNDADGQDAAGWFIEDHADCHPSGVRVMSSHQCAELPDDYRESDPEEDAANG
jgi:hypothetical protein